MNIYKRWLAFLLIVAAAALTSSASLAGPSGRVGPADHQMIDICLGKILGMACVNKFGRVIQIDSGITADIWDGGHTGDVSLIWVAPTEARIHALVSTSVEDSDVGGVVAQGDGARTLRVFGLTSWTTKETSEDLILDGTTAVNTIGSYVIIYRMKVLTKGSHATGPNVGTITATAATDSTVTAKLRPMEGQTQMSIFAFPSTQTLVLYAVRLSSNKAVGSTAGTADIRLLVNPDPDVELTNFLTKDTMGLQVVGASAEPIGYGVPKVIPGPAIIKLQAVSGTANMDLSGSFDGILVDN